MKLTVQPSAYIRNYRFASLVFQSSFIGCDKAVGAGFGDVSDIFVLEHTHGRNGKRPVADLLGLASRGLDVGGG